MNQPLRGLYAIVDEGGGPLIPQGKRLLACGVRTLQLRAKSLDRAALAEAGAALLPAARAQGALLIINDDLAVAEQIGADGLHLGQEDGPLGPARARLGPNALLGRSTHTLAQAQAALDEGADYIGFGPIFGTSTKQTGWSPRGLDQLAAVCAAVPLPVIAIGGIQAVQVPALQAAGAVGWAVISALSTAKDLSAAVLALDLPWDREKKIPAQSK